MDLEFSINFFWLRILFKWEIQENLLVARQIAFLRSGFEERVTDRFQVDWEPLFESYPKLRIFNSENSFQFWKVFREKF